MAPQGLSALDHPIGRHDNGADNRTREEGGVMRASVGDRIVVRGSRMGQPDRDCEVLELRGADGAPPYVVRWGDDGHTGLFFPGSDALVQHFEHTR